MKPTVFQGNALNEISFPLGGIGSGSIGLAGNGRLIDWEIFNRPSKGSTNGNSHFAVKAVKNGALLDARVLNGDVNTSLTGVLGHGYGTGLPGDTMAGFPHFKNCTFTGEFPVAFIDFSDDAFPGTVRLTAWNPLIPLNDKDSSIPAAFFDYAVTNTTSDALDYTFSGTLRNPYHNSVNTYLAEDGIAMLHLTQTGVHPDAPEYGDLTLAAAAVGTVAIQQYWYRGSWFDGLQRYWRNFTEQETYENRVYSDPGHFDPANLAVTVHAAPGETVHVRYVITWSRPNNYNYWSRYTKKLDDGRDVDVTWKNYYATLFETSADSAKYAIFHWDRLWAGTKRYHDELFSTSLPAEITEAIASTVSVLKTATVLRLENGEFYGWEGVNESWGSCEGTCTHVWNYAYALCYLFPNLERSIRETDFTYNQDEDGRMPFRMPLPLGRERGGWRACVDGQMGGVIKTYREWKLSGDDAWLRSWWPAVKKSIEYAWSESNYDRWDRDRDGVLEGRQHHTLDVELFGPSSWLEGFYLAALNCGAEMAEHLGDADTAAEYRRLFRQGQAWCEENLFNGKWYAQKVNLGDKTVLEPYADAMSYWNDESGEIKYQIGDGCLLDQCLAQWHANLNGMGEIFQKDHLRTALRNTYRNNFLPNMRSHYNTFRLFAVNDEAGAIICSFPKEIVTPAIPIPYAEESMHGFEYAFAGLLISEGFREEGESIVRAIRARYRGFNRNPYNEIECGSNYARSMASFALLPIYTGFRADLPHGKLTFHPIEDGEFRSLWFAGNAWGRFERSADGTTTLIRLDDGAHPLPLRELVLPYLDTVNEVTVDGASTAFEKKNDGIVFHGTFHKTITVR